MRFFHLSDLHIGRQLHYYNLKENQRAVLEQIALRTEEYRPDAVLICGDIFDKSVPSGEAYTIFDEFLNRLAEITPKIPVLLIGGNHDNPQRLGYAGAFLEKQQITVSALPPLQEGEKLKKVVLSDSFGPVNFYLLPFVKPGYIRHLYPEGQITDYTSAVREILNKEEVDQRERNVLLSHQFYVNGGKKPELCDSERAVQQVGGLDSVEVSVVEAFDYVALGHIHGAQQVGKPQIRYCGTPLKYSVSEEHHKKSITLVTLGEKGTASVIETIPLVPLQEVRRERGPLEEILQRAREDTCHDFISVTITDEKEPYHPMEQLQEKYDYILELRVDNQRTRSIMTQEETEYFDLQPMEIFRSFYEEMRSQPLSSEEEEWIGRILSKTEEAE